MVRFAAFALVALVAFQACSARHVLRAADSVVDSTYDAVFEVADGAAGSVFEAVYDASLEMEQLVRAVESAIVFEDIDPEMYGDPEVVVSKTLVKIDAAVASGAETYSGFTDAAVAKIADIVAQASAGVQDESVSALLALIQQKYTEALETAAQIANDFSENAADVAREAIDDRPDIQEVRVMEALRQMYKAANRSIERKINKAGEQIDAAIARA